tara:strand:+ start:41 stop:493 length:453 start_codon:yes stop_codon:yes gene_type:complete
MNDNLITCPHCESDACYVTENSPTIKTYSCFGCGFTSNSLMKEGEEFYAQQVEVLPELYKDVMFKDKEEKYWFPTTINVPQQGMVFYNGTSKENAKWAAVKAVPVLEEEKEKYKNKKGEFYSHRMDMTTMQGFEMKDFMEALSYINILPE